MTLVKSKQRVADHGEVFTPAWMVDAMLDLVKDESERIDSRFLEPACGSGNFLVRVLQRKLAAVELKYGKSDFERRHFALYALMCIYGIELLADNITECRANLLEVFAEYLSIEPSDELYQAACCVLSWNLIHGDALKMPHGAISAGENFSAVTSALTSSPACQTMSNRVRYLPSMKFSRQSKPTLR